MILLYSIIIEEKNSNQKLRFFINTYNYILNKILMDAWKYKFYLMLEISQIFDIFSLTNINFVFHSQAASVDKEVIEPIQQDSHNAPVPCSKRFIKLFNQQHHHGNEERQ